MTPGSAEDNAADFPDRPPTARAESLVGRQSRHLTDTTDRDQALEKAPSLIERKPALVDSAWTLSALAATEVEFWQAAKSRIHTRLRYEGTGDGWERFQLWS